MKAIEGNQARLTDGQLNALREVGQLGMEHAATALSQMLGVEVQLRMPQIQATEPERLQEIWTPAEGNLFRIAFQVLGDLRGHILLLFSESSARELLGSLLGEDRPGEPMEEPAASTLKEVGNILASAYLNALGGRLSRTLLPSVPQLTVHPGGEGVQRLPGDSAAVDRTVLLLETEFSAAARPGIFHGQLLLLFPPLSLPLLLRDEAILA